MAGSCRDSPRVGVSGLLGLCPAAACTSMVASPLPWRWAIPVPLQHRRFKPQTHFLRSAIRNRFLSLSPDTSRPAVHHPCASAPSAPHATRCPSTLRHHIPSSLTTPRGVVHHQELHLGIRHACDTKLEQPFQGPAQISRPQSTLLLLQQLQKRDLSVKSPEQGTK
jgi:hypothetical protein